MKMQIAFRGSTEKRLGYDVAIAVGIIEVGPDDQRDFENKGLAMKFHFDPSCDHPLLACAFFEPHPISGPGAYALDPACACTLEGMVTSSIARAIPNENHNADILLRQTELPASVEGGRVFAFSGLIHTEPGQKFDLGSLCWFEQEAENLKGIMSFTGRSGLEHRPEYGPTNLTEMMLGCDLGSYLKAPLWGFCEEPFALPGTMSLENYRKLDRYTELFFAEKKSDAELAEFERLAGFMRGAGLDNLRKDDRFARFMGEMRAFAPHSTANVPLSYRQHMEHESRIKEVIEKMFADDSPNRSMG